MQGFALTRRACAIAALSFVASVPTPRRGRASRSRLSCPSRPEVPTLAEASVKGIDTGTWFGLLAPAATPKEIVMRLNADVVKLLTQPEFRRQLEAIGAEPVGNSPEQMARQVKDDSEKFARLVKDAKVVIE